MLNNIYLIYCILNLKIVISVPFILIFNNDIWCWCMFYFVKKGSDISSR